MATIVTRSGKGSPLTNTEVDSNFTNLNTDKLETSGGTITGDLNVNGDVTLGNATTDEHTINGSLEISSTTDEANLTVKTTFSGEASRTPDVKIYNNSTQSGDDNELGLIQFFSNTANYSEVQFADVMGMAFSTGATDLEGGVRFRFSNANQASWQANRHMSFRPSKIQYFTGATNKTTTLEFTDPTADRTITLPDAAGQVVLSSGAINSDASAEIGRAHIGNVGHSGMAGFSHVAHNASTDYALIQDSNGRTYLNAHSGRSINFNINNFDVMDMTSSGLFFVAGKKLIFEGSTSDDYETFIGVVDPTADREINFPDAAGTVSLTSATETLTNKTFDSDVTFNNNTGAGLTWDKSANYLKFSDNARASFGTSNELTIHHQNIGGIRHSFITNNTGNLAFINNTDDANVDIFSDDGSGGTVVYFSADGSTGESILYHYGTQKLSTKSTGVEIDGGILDIKNDGSQSEVRLYCESNNAHYASLKAPAHADFSGDITLTLPASTGTLLSTANSDAPTTTTSSGDADFVLVDDGGVMKKITPANLGIGSGTSGITVQDEGSSLSTAGTTLNFVGAGVTASGTGATKTITISGGGSSSGGALTDETWGASLDSDSANESKLFFKNARLNVIIDTGSSVYEPSPNLDETNTSAVNNVFIGNNAGYAATTGYQNVLIGAGAGDSVTTGYQNTLIGCRAGDDTTTGYRNTFIGYEAGDGVQADHRLATYVGYRAGYLAVGVGQQNITALGYEAGYRSRENSTSIGHMAGSQRYYSSGGVFQGTSVGSVAGGHYYAYYRSYNVDVGYRSGYENRQGDYSTHIGWYADGLATDTDYAVAIGADAKAAGYSVSIGYQSQDSGNSGSNNMVSIGHQAAYDMDGGDNGVFIGYRAAYNGGTGSNNVGIGFNALYDLTDGVNNSALGYRALYELTGGDDNTAIGYQAGNNITTAERNVFIGYNAGLGGSNPANNNTGVGYESLKAITGGGAANTGFGYNSLLNVTTGDYNVSLGYHCADGVSTASSNIAVGHYANCGNSDNNIAMGFYARAYSGSISIGYEAGTNSGSQGQSNVSIGFRAGQEVSGDRNVFVGSNAGRGGGSSQSSNGDNNVGLGDGALLNLSNGENNAALGYSALGSITSADNVVGIGRQAGTGAQTTSNSVYIGYQATSPNGASLAVAIGSQPRACKWGVSIGTQAGGDTFSSNTSTFNVLIGYRAGYEITGDDNTGIGPYALYNDSTSTAYSGDNLTCIGYKAIPSAIGVSNEITLGNSSVATLRCQVTSITALSDQRDKTDIEDLDLGLKFVNAMKPRKFTWNRRDGKWVGKKELGFIAQELHELEMDFSSTERTRLVNYENPSRLEAQPMNTYPILVKAIQELSAKVDSLQAEITKLKGA